MNFTAEVQRLGDEIELAYGHSLPAHSRNEGDIPVFGSNGRVGVHNAASVSGPGVIVGRKGSVGEVNFSGEDFWPIDTTYYVVNKKNHDWNYLYYLLRFVDLTNLNSHSAVPGLNREDAYAIQAWFPDKPTQQKVAKILRQVESSIEINESLIHHCSDLKASAMHTLFSRGLRGEPQRDSELGPVPQSWETKQIGDICDIWSGGTPRKSVPEYWAGDIPWVSGKDLKLPKLSDVRDHITAEAVSDGSRLAPADAVLLLVRGMGLAKDLPVSVITRPMAFNQDVKALVSRGEVSGSFLRSAIYSRKEDLLSQCVTSAHGTKTLNLSDVESFKIAFPTDRIEHDEIVAILDAIDQKIDLHKRKRAVLEELFKSLLHKLMTGEVRVADLDLSALDSLRQSAAQGGEHGGN